MGVSYIAADHLLNEKSNPIDIQDRSQKYKRQETGNQKRRKEKKRSWAQEQLSDLDGEIEGEKKKFLAPCSVVGERKICSIIVYSIT